MPKLAKAPSQAVKSRATIEIVPKSWEKTFFNWMENIQPWCVSRQLWWGHRIPWLGKLATMPRHGRGTMSPMTELKKPVSKMSSSTPKSVILRIFPDPHTIISRLSTPGSLPRFGPSPRSVGPRKTDAISRKHYPNDLLISGFDILFFWDARMMMQGMHFT